MGFACTWLLLLGSTSLAETPAADTRPTDACGPAAVCPLSGDAIRSQDEFWVIDSRGLCTRSPDELVGKLRFEQYLPGKGWTRSQLGDFAIETKGETQAKRTVTSFFIVGNYYTHAEAIETGWYAYHQLVAQCADDAAVRFVVWSWPSDPVPGRRLADAKIKFTRVDPSAFQLAVLIDRLDPTVPLTFCGSSFGAGIAAGALQLLAGGRLGSYQLAPAARPRRRMRVVMLGAAIHNDSLLPGRRYDRTVSQAERLLVFVNPADLALRVYHRLFGRRRTIWALGLTGPVGVPRSSDGSRVDLAWSNPYVGRQHGMMPHWQSPTLVAWMRPYLLMQDLTSKQKATAPGPTGPPVP